MLAKLRCSACFTIAAVILVAGCGRGGDKASTQVAAKVNKEEISVHQINYMLAHAGQIPPEQQKAASKQALERLVEQELMVQKAMAAKLDRDPNVMQTIEANRRQVLAQAYMAQVTSAASKPGASEVQEYYDKHPELFSQRRIYRFQQLSIAGGKDVASELEQRLSGGKASMDDLVAWAKEKNLRYNTNTAVKPAEQLPMEMLPQLHHMKDGQMGMIREPVGVSVIQLIASQDQPVEQKAATAVIEQFLLNKRKSELAQNELKQLRTSATIEYVGDFAQKDGDKPSATDAKPAAATTP
jgi:EpsD family peptidyl-prolyl cis-trans isomerase